MRALLLVSVLFFTSLCVAKPQPMEAGIGVSLLRYDSREYDDDGSLLNRESGWLPALSGFLVMPLSARWRLRTEGELAYGTVDYQGQTQLGLPFNSSTDTGLYQGRVALGYCTSNCRQQFYAGLGGYLRTRDIDSRAGVNGLSERYRWAEWHLGLVQALQPDQPERWQLQAELFYLSAAQMKVDLRFAGYGQPRIPLPNSLGHRLGLSFKPRHSALTLKLSWQRLNINESKAVLASSSSSTILVSEPASEADHWRLGVILPL